MTGGLTVSDLAHEPRARVGRATALAPTTVRATSAGPGRSAPSPSPRRPADAGPSPTGLVVPPRRGRRGRGRGRHRRRPGPWCSATGSTAPGPTALRSHVGPPTRPRAAAGFANRDESYALSGGGRISAGAGARPHPRLPDGRRGRRRHRGHRADDPRHQRPRGPPAPPGDVRADARPGGRGPRRGHRRLARRPARPDGPARRPGRTRLGCVPARRCRPADGAIPRRAGQVGRRHRGRPGHVRPADVVEPAALRGHGRLLGQPPQRAHPGPRQLGRGRLVPPRRHPDPRARQLHRHAAGVRQPSGDAALPDRGAVEEGLGQRELRTRAARAAHGRRGVGLHRGRRAQQRVHPHRAHRGPARRSPTRAPSATTPGGTGSARCRCSTSPTPTPPPRAGSTSATPTCVTWPRTRPPRRPIARKLAVRFVSDTPPTSLVDRLATAYLDGGTAIVPVLDMLFRSAEFWASVGQKTRRPAENIAASVRVVGVRARERHRAQRPGALQHSPAAPGTSPSPGRPPTGTPTCTPAWRSAAGWSSAGTSTAACSATGRTSSPGPTRSPWPEGPPRSASSSTTSARACASRRSSPTTATRSWPSSAATRRHLVRQRPGRARGRPGPRLALLRAAVRSDP